MRKIVLLAGHNPTRFGAEHNGIKEYYLSKYIVDRIIKITEPEKIGVELITFNIDKLTDKIKRVNEINPALAIDLHWNACPDPHVKGSEAFYYEGGSGVSKKLSRRYCEIFEQVSGIKTRGGKPDTLTQFGDKGLAWCRQIACPSILVENEFLTYKDFDFAFYDYASIMTLLRFINSIKG